MGDLLALFRCISCRFNFSADPEAQESLGAPGRVYLSGEPELACNVQLYPRSAYLRRAEAEQCRVQSSMLLPVFLVSINSGSKGSGSGSGGAGGKPIGSSGSISLMTGSDAPRKTLGVIEVVQTSDDMAFLPVAQLLGIILEKCGLATSSVDEVRARLPTAATNLELPLRTGVLEPADGADPASEDIVSSDDRQNNTAAEPRRGRLTRASSGAVPAGAAGARRQNSLGVPDSDHDFADGGDDGVEDDSGAEDGSDSDEDDGRRRKRGTARRNVKGKPGVKLSLADLQGQFGVGLKDAANALGVCTTTLKRACRRHGIQRWPRRALQKVARALDEMERRKNINDHTNAAGNVGSLVGGAPGGGMPTMPFAQQLAATQGPGMVDSRWSALASMIPSSLQMAALQQGMVTGGGGGGGGGMGGIAAAAAGGGPSVLPQNGASASAWMAGAQIPFSGAPPSEASLPEGVMVMPGGTAHAAARAAAAVEKRPSDVPSLVNVPGPGVSVASWGTGPSGGGGGFRSLQAAQPKISIHAVAGGSARQARSPGGVPLSPKQGAGAGPGFANLQSPFIAGPAPTSDAAPMLALPSEGPALSFGPGFSLPNLSQLSVPSFNPSMFPGMSFGVANTNEPKSSGPPDDVGLLDSTILELMLSE